MARNRMPARISTRAILTGAVLFNVVAIGLSEVQRRGLIYRAEEMMIRLDQNRNHETVAQLARLQKTVDELDKQIKDVSLSVASLRIIANVALNVDKAKLATRVADRLNDGRPVVILFDDNAREDRDQNGHIRCGPSTQNGYLGAFVAGGQYTVSYNRLTHQWTGSGPAQSRSSGKDSGSCLQETAIYGPKELGKTITPADAVVLWGAQFKLDGLALLLDGHPVGRVVWGD